jgi:hypothetical protein
MEAEMREGVLEDSPEYSHVAGREREGVREGG